MTSTSAVRITAGKTAFGLLCLWLSLCTCWPQTPQHPVTGRTIAPVMSAAGASWLERPEREREEQPEKALDEIGIAKGSVIADLGAGTGYFTKRLAARTGPAGKVFAVDIQPRMLELLRDRLQREKIANVAPLLGTEEDPRLPANSVDLVLMVDVYHEFSRPREMLQGIRSALKPGGRLVLLEYRKEDPNVPIRIEHKMTVDEVRAELEAGGFRLDRVSDALPRQHILVFRKQEPVQ